MAESKRPLFCLIDASAFIFRAFYAVRPLSNKQGLPTNAVDLKSFGRDAPHPYRRGLRQQSAKLSQRDVRCV
ncbi:MAG: hypothetical protein EOP11_19540 [Proteobacteria bacterium]|nr:MAG: hypothetical protein EOP11_19540 [Pseudomonadota bacterium]